jgi:hypothetical protein
MSMLRKLGLAISYFIAIVFILSILLSSIYCLRHGCRGAGELDAFMPALFITVHFIVRSGLPPSPELRSNQKTLPLVEVAGYAERS